MSDDLRSAVAAGVLGAEKSYAQLLQSIVEVARAIFRAKASSVFLLDEEADELVFEAVAGEGSESLVGRRFPSEHGNRGFRPREPATARDRGRARPTRGFRARRQRAPGSSRKG